MADGKSFLESFGTGTKPESFEQEKFTMVQGNRNRIRTIAAVAAAVVLLVVILLVYLAASNVRVPELAGMTVDEASVWATKNRIVLSAKSVYDFDTEAGTVLSQAQAAGDTIRKNAALAIEVSLGADPDEAIAWPDIKAMTVTEIETWISDNKLTGVKIATANSDLVAADDVISYSLTDGTEENFARKSRATVTVSLGLATLSDTVVVSDFTSMKAAAIRQWGTDNSVTVVLTEDFDDYVASGSVVSQSVKATTEIKRTETINVVISKGKPIPVPDISALTQEEGSAWAKTNNVSLTTKTLYSSSLDAGKLISQSLASGSVMAASDALKLTYSLGRVEVASYIGKTKLDLQNWLKTANANGAGLTLTIQEDYGEKGSVGKIISQSVKNDYVNPGASLSATVSLGMKIVTPDFAGKTAAECSSLGQSSGVTVLFDYQESGDVAQGLVITQSPAAYAVITDANPVTVVISITGGDGSTVTVPDFSAMKTPAILQWGVDNGVTVQLAEAYNSFVSNGSVLSQSAAKNAIVAKDTVLTVTLSKGPAPVVVTVPDLTAMTRDEATAWAKTNNLTLTVVEQYRAAPAEGGLYDPSVGAGANVTQGSEITVHYSLGQVDIASYVGKTRLDVANWLSGVNAKGAGITATYAFANDLTRPMNTVVDQSIMNTCVNPGAAIVFTLSWEP